MPTSLATRVTSDVNALICSIMAFTMLAERRNSPCSGRPSTSRAMVCDRSPLATAAMARVTSVVGHSRSSISVLTEPSIAPQEPERRSSPTRWRVRPSLPTMRPARSSSLASRSLEPTISLNVSATLPASPALSPGRRTEKSPSRTDCRARRISRRSRASASLPAPFVLRRLGSVPCSGDCILILQRDSRPRRRGGGLKMVLIYGRSMPAKGDRRRTRRRAACSAWRWRRFQSPLRRQSALHHGQSPASCVRSSVRLEPRQKVSSNEYRLAFTGYFAGKP